MAMTTFKNGNPLMVDYTPSGGNVASGDIVIIANATANSTTGAAGLVGIAHHAITNNTLGALAISGAIYSILNINNAATGAIVYFDGTNRATTVTNSNCLLGKIVANGAAGTNSACLVELKSSNV